MAAAYHCVLTVGVSSRWLCFLTMAISLSSAGVCLVSGDSLGFPTPRSPCMFSCNMAVVCFACVCGWMDSGWPWSRSKHQSYVWNTHTHIHTKWHQADDGETKGNIQKSTSLWRKTCPSNLHYITKSSRKFHERQRPEGKVAWRRRKGMSWWLTCLGGILIGYIDS